MPYVISWSEVTGRYPELAKLPDVTSAAQVTMIAAAEGAIHGRLAPRWTTPFSTSNQTAKNLCIDMVFVQTQLSRQPEKAKIILDALDGEIEGLLDGTRSMVNTSGEMLATSVSDAVWSSTEDYPPTFGVGAIEDFQVSSGQTYDEASERGDYV